jgi:hypothetical protein
MRKSTSDSSGKTVITMTKEEQVHRGREEGDPGEEDFRDPRNMDDAL